jgi:hypothetical protein
MADFEKGKRALIFAIEFQFTLPCSCLETKSLDRKYRNTGTSAERFATTGLHRKSALARPFRGFYNQFKGTVTHGITAGFFLPR